MKSWVRMSWKRITIANLNLKREGTANTRFYGNIFPPPPPLSMRPIFFCYFLISAVLFSALGGSFPSICQVPRPIPSSWCPFHPPWIHVEDEMNIHGACKHDLVVISIWRPTWYPELWHIARKRCHFLLDWFAVLCRTRWLDLIPYGQSLFKRLCISIWLFLLLPPLLSSPKPPSADWTSNPVLTFTGWSSDLIGSSYLPTYLPNLVPKPLRVPNWKISFFHVRFTPTSITYYTKKNPSRKLLPFWSKSNILLLPHHRRLLKRNTKQPPNKNNSSSSSTKDSNLIDIKHRLRSHIILDRQQRREIRRLEHQVRSLNENLRLREAELKLERERERERDDGGTKRTAVEIREGIVIRALRDVDGELEKVQGRIRIGDVERAVGGGVGST